MPRPYPIPAVVLCAGGSRRMGTPKGLLDLGGRSVLARHVDAWTDAGHPVVVVLGAEQAAHRAVLPGHVQVVVNPDWHRSWPADSLRLALAGMPPGPCFVAPVDSPPPRAATVAALLAAGPPAVPTDPRGRPGHPVLLSEAVAARVRDAAPVGGVRVLLDGAHLVPVADTLVAQDFDDPDSWRAFSAAWRRV